MTFNEFQKIFESKFGINHLADIARELKVTPQVVSNWKSRDRVPYKYVKKLRKLISSINASAADINRLPKEKLYENMEWSTDGGNEHESIDIIKFIIYLKNKIFDKIVLFISIPSLICSLQIYNVTYVIQPTFISSAKIMPEKSSNSSGNLSGIASKFGINMGPSGAGSSLSLSDLYPEILKSRTLSRRLLDRKFDTKEFGNGQKLLKILTYGNKDQPDNLEVLRSKAIDKLTKKMIDVKPVLNSPLIIISSKTSEAKFAKQLTNAFIDELGKIEEQYLTGKATEKRIFISNRIEDAKISLQKSEEDLKSFREKNRDILKSPALQLEASRLMREQEVQTQVYLTLKRELELAQIEEIEMGSMVMVLDPPEIPLKRSAPNKPRILIITGIVSLLISSFIIMREDLLNYIRKEILK